MPDLGYINPDVLSFRCVWEALELAALNSYGAFTTDEIEILKAARDFAYGIWLEKQNK